MTQKNHKKLIVTNMSPGTNFKKLFTLVIYQFFVAPGKLFQPSLMFAGKAGAKPREELSGVPL
jgi:hypothetical protein